MKQKRNIWLDVDLDYFNYADDPKLEVRKLLVQLLPSTPAVIVVEHHRVVAHVRRAVGSGALSTPCTVLHVDHHHDYYKDDAWRTGTGGKRTVSDCGCFMYFLEKQWYDDVVWIAPPDGSAEIYCNMWISAKRWLRRNGKKASCTEQIPWVERKWHRKWHKDRVGFITFTVSPDYLEDTMRDSIEKIIGMIAKHFSLDTTVEPAIAVPDGLLSGTPDACGCPSTSPKDWCTVIRRNGKTIVRNRDNIASGRLKRLGLDVGV